MAEEMYEEVEVPVRENGDDAEIRDTDIVFDCPHCGKNLVIDYRGAGLQINCSECGAVCDKHDVFCPKCGNKLDKRQS